MINKIDLKKQSILELTKLIEEKVDMSEMALAKYLGEIFNAKKEINIEFLKLLLKTNIDKTAKLNSGFTAPLLAALFGDPKLTQVLIDNGFDMNEKIEFTQYALHNDGTPNYEDKTVINVSSFSYAFYKYNSENIKLLIENGTDVNTKIYEPFEDIYTGYSTALSKSTKKNDTDMVKFLINQGAKDLNNNHLIEACRNNNLELVNLFVNEGVDVNPSTSDEIPFFFSTPLVAVCGNYNFIANGEKVEWDKPYNKKSIINKRLEIVKILLENGADVNLISPLMALCSNNDGFEIDFFGEQKNNTDIERVYIDVEIVKLLLKYGANINDADSNGKSILMEVCDRKENGFDIAKILIENNVDINHKDNNGNSVLMLLNDYQIDKIIPDFKEDGSYYEEEKEIYPSEELMTLLLKNGADINTKNKMGMTPLMHYSLKGEDRLVKILLENGADVNAKSEMTAFDLAQNDEIKTLIQSSKNNSPQGLVKLLANFTIDKPIKYTTHDWDFGELKKEYKNFDGYMDAVKKQFESIKNELEELSPNLYKKVYTFLLETNPDEHYSWCHKTHVKIGWSSLDGLQEWCDNGNKPESFTLKKPICYEEDFETRKLTKFKDIINLFKQEIEIRANFNNLENLFANQVEALGSNFNLDLSAAKLSRQFYTDVEKFSNALDRIFADMGTRIEYSNIKVITTELEDRSIEIKITQIDSYSSMSSTALLQRAKQAGDISEIKNALINLCDWSIESSFEGENFRVNFLHSNNVKDIEILETKPRGFTHILRFYK